MTRLALALALALALLAGCALPERGPGDETLVVSNQTGDLVEVLLRIEARGGIPIFAEDIILERGGSREFELEMAPGVHAVYLTTTSGLSEVFPIEIPENGDSRIEATVMRGTATVSVVS